MPNTRLTFFNTTIGITALGVQLFLLYPWHNDLDREFKKLKAEHSAELTRLKNLKTDSNNKVLGKLDEILERLDTNANNTHTKPIPMIIEEK